MKKLFVYLLIGMHLAFLAITALGGLFVLMHKGIMVLHIPMLIWAVVVEVRHLDCPLTQWENSLRKQAGMPAYEGGFIDHYLLTPILGEKKPAYFELVLSLVVVGTNLIAYGYLLVS